ncbi:MAG: hypothetical protein QXW07_03560 [Candidatus Woesearchaeota archaeon]
MSMKKKKTKHLTSLAVVFLVLVTLAGNSEALLMPGYYLRATLINQDPYPVDAGQYVTLRFRIENLGREIAKNVQIQLVQEYPFYLDTGEDGIKNIGTLESLQTGSLTPIIEYKVRVDERAISGSNTIKLRYRIDNSEWVDFPEFSVEVRRYFKGLVLNKISTSSQYFEPGQEAQLNITLKNLAEAQMRDITVALLINEALPLAPTESGLQQKSYGIEPNGIQTFPFKLIVSPSAAAGLYKIPVTITYKDDANVEHSVNEMIGILINPMPRIDLLLESANPISQGYTGPVTIRIVNSGIGSARFIEAEASEVDGLSIISGAKQYVGEISSDDYDTLELRVHISKTANGTLQLPVKLRYADSLGRTYTENKTVSLRVYTASEQRALGIYQRNNSLVLWILVTAAFAVIYLIYRKRKHSHVQHK